MMNRKDACLETLEKSHIVSVIRISFAGNLVPVMSSLYAGGVKIIEITSTTPSYCQNIESLRKEFSSIKDCFVGAGTILTMEELRRAIDAGADFIVSPVFDEEIVAECVSRGIAVIPGCMTPSEIYHAWISGASVVKTFPGRVCTPEFYKDILGPFPTIKMMPTGNVDTTTAPRYIHNGAVAVGIGKALVSEVDIVKKDWKAIEEHAKEFSSLLSGI
jgi:2-dehydro-3-deoxyphosphogluconate aldolase/(4S)-4-hydroxy-2-oxoglutarate aldolase